MKKFLPLSVIILSATLGAAFAGPFEQDRQAILGSTGCFIVDYNYHEVESLLPHEYKLDAREYHSSVNEHFKKYAQMYSMLDPAVTSDKYQLTVKEKIYARVDSANVIHLQHIIFLTDKNGALDFVMKHHSERWKYEADFTFDYVGNSLWSPIAVENSKGKWTREMNALDDSPRYSCTAAWDHTRQYPSWTCANFSPIPGREYRDMSRDYQALNRIHELTVYPHAWLDTQNNEKVYEKADGSRVAFAKEKGRNWYTRLKDEDCNVVDSFIEERKGFWEITQNVWDELLNTKEGVYDTQTGAPRWLPINGGPFIIHPGRKLVQYSKGLEEKFVTALKEKQNNPNFKIELSAEIKSVIGRNNKKPL